MRREDENSMKRIMMAEDDRRSDEETWYSKISSLFDQRKSILVTERSEEEGSEWLTPLEGINSSRMEI